MRVLIAALLLWSLSACMAGVGGRLDTVEAPLCVTRPQVFVDRNWLVFFDANSSRLSQRAWTIPGELVNRWKRDGGDLVEVQSHTDAQEVRTSSPALPRQRADAVRLNLIAGGVGAGRLTTQSFGATRPLVPDDQAEPQNRFVELLPHFHQSDSGLTEGAPLFRPASSPYSITAPTASAAAPRQRPAPHSTPAGPATRSA